MKTNKPMNISTKILIIFFTAVFFSPGISAKGLDPLDAAEMSNAVNLSTPRQLRNRSATPNPAQEPELLLIERRPAEKGKAVQRLADIYRYDYAQDQTIHTVVNLDTQDIVSNERHQFMQLPLTGNEVNRSIDIIFKDTEQLALLRDEYLRITGNYLADPEQLHIKAFSFSSDTMPEPLNTASLQCGLNRCAQLLLYTHDSIVFEVSPIVNLSAGIVTQNIGY